MKLSIGYLTFPTKAEAKEAVMSMLEHELIACANIFDKVESYYVWGKEIDKANEVVVIVKTKVKNEDKLIRFMRKYHSYEIPCVVFTSIEHGNGEYLKWVNDSC